MDEEKSLMPFVDFEVVKVKKETDTPATIPVASEIPYTIMINEKELATLLCTPAHLKELTYGFVFTSGIVQRPGEVIGYTLDREKWIGYLELEKAPDFELLSKRIYTSGCGKGIMYSSYVELASRDPVVTSTRFKKTDIHTGMHYLLQYSELYKKTGGVHTVALGRTGQDPHIAIDDIGRHNALDKVIGRALLAKEPFADSLLFCTGRISSEMLHKAKRCEIPVIVSRGAPTHQAVLRARAMGITLVGFVRTGEFTIFSHPERIVD
jgi:FdhD protein